MKAQYHLKLSLPNVAAAVALLLSAQGAWAVSSYRSLVPNGFTNSCSTCHTVAPTLNPFGQDFLDANLAWSPALAALDSDGDGFSNGQELADPLGLWVSGAPPPIPGAQITRPGDPGSVPQLRPPPVSLSSPADGATLPAPFTGPIIASTTLPMEAVTRVQFFSGTVLLGTATVPPYSLAVNLPAGSYTLTARLIDYLGASNTSASVAITVQSAANPPTITLQPVSQTVTAGANVTFTIAATGTAPLHYQWRKGGANIGGANGASLTLNNVAAGDAGSYDAVVTNIVGSATSTAATLTVNPAPLPPMITLQPVSQTVTAGANVTFTIAATGTAPLHYQWRKGGANIGGANGASLTLNSVTAGDAGSYDALVTNIVGSATSTAATLTVNPAPLPPLITLQPVSQTVTAGANVTFTVAATGTAPLHYQWRKGGANIGGANGTSLTLNSVTAGDAGSYDAVVTNIVGLATSTAATLTVNPAPLPPLITLQPVSQTVTEGANVTFTIAATGTAPLHYQWRKGGANIGGANGASLTLNSVTAGDAGSYDAVVTNIVGSATSTAATLTVNPAPLPPLITLQPVSQTVTAGANVTFTIAATGTAPLHYQWRKGGANIGGANGTSLTLNSVTAGDAGSYDAVVTNIVGSATSTAATLTVNPAPLQPLITLQPVSQTVTEGANVTFTIAATGTAPLHYQWRKGGANIGGANGTSLTLNSVAASDAGSYDAVVTNIVGSATSTAATLTVNPLAITVVLTSPPDGAVFTAPATVSLEASVTPAAIVTNVDFFTGTTLLGSLRAPPFSFTLHNVGAGHYILTAVAAANNGTTATSAPVAITVEGPPPVGGAAVVTVVATDADASEVGPDPGTFQVSRTGEATNALTVYYLLGGTAINGQDYQAVSNTVTIPEGESTADITVVPILDMDSDQEVSDTVILQLTSAPVGEPGYDIGSPSNAVVTIMEAITPSTNQAPVVQLVSPDDGARFTAGARIALAALATDPDGMVTSVEFFAGTMSLGVVTNASGGEGSDDGEEGSDDGEGGSLYQLVWRNVPAGGYDLTAVATDNLGATGVSSPVHITVNARTNPPPVVTITAADSFACASTSASANTAAFRVRRTGSTNADLMVSYSTSGTATNGVDYEALPGSVVIPAGRRSATITVVPLPRQGTSDRSARTVVLTLLADMAAPPSYVVGTPGQAAAVIALCRRGDDDYERSSGLLGDGSFHLVQPAASGQSAYRLEVSTNLVDWETICTNRITDGAVHFVDPESQNATRRFYRTIPVPPPPADGD